MKKFIVNTKDSSYDELTKVARKCGFIIFQGSKHCKVRTVDGKPITTIPRHNSLKRETAKGIVNAMIDFGCEIDFI